MDGGLTTPYRMKTATLHNVTQASNHKKNISLTPVISPNIYDTDAKISIPINMNSPRWLFLKDKWTYGTKYLKMFFLIISIKIERHINPLKAEFLLNNT
jgi:hypothetical protein